MKFSIRLLLYFIFVVSITLTIAMSSPLGLWQVVNVENTKSQLTVYVPNGGPIPDALYDSVLTLKRGGRTTEYNVIGTSHAPAIGSYLRLLTEEDNTDYLYPPLVVVYQDQYSMRTSRLLLGLAVGWLILTLPLLLVVGISVLQKRK